MGGGMGHPMMGGMGQGMQGAMGPGAMGGGPAGRMAGQALMTPEERQALADKMRNATTPKERQKLAETNRAEMEKRAKEKGITLPQPHGPRATFGPNFAPPFAAPTR
jgi:Spy/CpxP family protein refolding chaperone